jgi:hypothetical protein
MVVKSQWIVSLLIILTLSMKAFAENNGSIQGRVIDQNTKQPLPGATVMIEGTKYGAISDNNGVFLIKDVEEDIYLLRVSYMGYQSFVKPNVRVIRNKTTLTDEIALSETSLELGTVVVSTGAFHDDAKQPVSNFSYSNEEIERNPGSAGDVFRALATMPGVSIGSGGEFAAFSVRGGSPRENLSSWTTSRFPRSRIWRAEEPRRKLDRADDSASLHRRCSTRLTFKPGVLVPTMVGKMLRWSLCI